MIGPLPLQVLVEEISAEFALRALLPKIVPSVDHEILSFRDKTDLLKKLPQRLACCAAWPGASQVQVVVLVDQDRDDCVSLRQQLDDIVVRAGFEVAGARRGLVSRIAVEELEAWFHGLPKTSVAAEVAECMEVEKNSSRSFQVFRDGVRRLVTIEESDAQEN